MEEENGKMTLPILSPSNESNNFGAVSNHNQCAENLQQAASNPSASQEFRSPLRQSARPREPSHTGNGRSRRQFRPPLGQPTSDIQDNSECNVNNEASAGRSELHYQHPLRQPASAKEAKPEFKGNNNASGGRYNQQYQPPLGRPASERQENSYCNCNSYALHGNMTVPGGFQTSYLFNKFMHPSHCNLSVGDSQLMQMKREIKSPTHDQWMGLVTPEGALKNESYMKQILRHQPDAQIVLAQHDYTEFQYEMVFDLEQPSILEMYDFSPSVATADVRDMFKEYSDVSIKWVDRTHLLLIFCNAEEAAYALQTAHSNCRLRLLINASPLSKYIAIRDHIVQKKENKEN